eukprot:scaffold5602_cov161-Skeletonema_marinoi.AAC.2
MQQQGRTAPEAEGMNHSHSQETAVKHKASESMGDDDNSKEPSARLREEHDRKKEEDGCALEMMAEPSSSSSSTSTLDDFLSLSPTPLSSSLYSSMQLPTACLNEHDGCDEAELIARAKRCEEIMKLSQQAIDAEAARVKAANIKPLVWAKPTFEIDSLATDTTTDDDVAAADETHAEESHTEESREADKLGKRKGSPTNTPQHYSPYHLERLSYIPRRKSTPEEVQAFVEFTDKWIPSAKRRSTGSGNDNEEESKGEEVEVEEESSGDGAASASSSS